MVIILWLTCYFDINLTNENYKRQIFLVNTRYQFPIIISLWNIQITIDNNTEISIYNPPKSCQTLKIIYANTTCRIVFIKACIFGSCLSELCYSSNFSISSHFQFILIIITPNVSIKNNYIGFEQKIRMGIFLLRTTNLYYMAVCLQSVISYSSIKLFFWGVVIFYLIIR